MASRYIRRTTDCAHCIMTTVRDLCRTASIDEIVRIDDPVLRNFCITWSYHLLSRAVGEVLGLENANWCTFASWASEQAGRSIRKENLPLSSWNPLGYADRVSRAVSAGNRKVYAEIAPVFDRFLRLVRDPAGDAVRAFEAAAGEGADAASGFVHRALELDPRPWSEETPDGQALLVVAFTLYFRALLEADPDARAELLFVANSHVGLHEQMRLNEDIGAALEMPEIDRLVASWVAPLARVGERVGRRWLSAPGHLPRAVRRLHDGALAGAVAGRRVGETVRRSIALARACGAALKEGRAPTAPLGTRAFMTLKVAGEEISLARDLEPVDGGALFPAHLRTFDTPCAEFRRHLEAVLAYDRTPDALQGSGAVDWSKLGDRMNFILDLFRSRQQDRRLFHNPLAERLGGEACACRGAARTGRLAVGMDRLAMAG